MLTQASPGYHGVAQFCGVSLIWRLPWALQNSKSSSVLGQWLMKQTTRAVAQCASSFLFVAEWSWQRARAGSCFRHTSCQSPHCFCSWHLFPVHPNYNSITESCDSHTFHHLGGLVRTGLPWHRCPVPSFLHIHHCLGIWLVLLGSESLHS